MMLKSEEKVDQLSLVKKVFEVIDIQAAQLIFQRLLKKKTMLLSLLLQIQDMLLWNQLLQENKKL